MAHSFAIQLKFDRHPNDCDCLGKHGNARGERDTTPIRKYCPIDSAGSEEGDPKWIAFSYAQDRI
jgi:hypothetical protein